MICYLCGRELTKKERRGYYNILRIKCNVCINIDKLDDLKSQIEELKKKIDREFLIRPTVGVCASEIQGTVIPLQQQIDTLKKELINHDHIKRWN